ncbi:hypothetical protein TNCV_2358591 [Trichonephila clavipes]|nr:hypothetical protein TNCV_2358591 [Trichonephila clavipes]
MFFANKKNFDCRADTVSINESPERNFFTDFGSPPIPLRAFCMAKGDFCDILLFGKDKIKNRECLAIVSMAVVGKTWPLPGHCKLGSISVKQTSFWRASTHHEVQQGRQCAGHLVNTRRGSYQEYTQNIVIQHQGVDPTGKPTTPFLQP